MTRTIRVARFHGPEDFRFDEVQAAPVGDRQIRVDIAYNGVCGTDVHLYYEPDVSGVPIVRDDAGQIAPIPIGHEYAGTITEVGAQAAGFRVGDRVSVYPVAYCGRCDACLSGAPTFLCTDQGMAAGGVGEEIVVDAHLAHLLPDGVDLIQGALVEPMAVSAHAVALADPGTDDTIVVAGAGPIGIGIFLALRARGHGRLIVSEPHAGRRATIEGLGARTVDPLEGDLAAAVAELSHGRGALFFFDAAGGPAVFAQGMEVLGFSGTFVVVAVNARPIPIDLWPIQIAEKRIITSMAYRPEDFDAVIVAMAAGAYPTDGWVSVRPAAELTEVVAELRAGAGTKVLLQSP